MADMKERPILFSGPMVRAILEGRKTQTRRVIKADTEPGMECTRLLFKGRDGSVRVDTAAEGELVTALCPYGKPGDRLWVRETWRPWGWREDNPVTVQFAADGAKRCTTPTRSDDGYEDWYERVVVQATDECAAAKCEQDAEGNYFWNGDECPIKWRPSIFLPRWASRLTLEITKVRVERVQDISEEDAIAEGTRTPIAELPKSCQQAAWSERQQFSRLWDSINAKRKIQTADGEREIPYVSWAANPWLWVIEFNKIRGDQPCQK